jgi:CubicO group peptidase (beta-lactamase class C family)
MFRLPQSFWANAFRQFVGALIVLLIASACARKSATQIDDQRIDAFVTAEMARQRVPGVAVAIVKHGELVKAKGYGLANVELNVPMKPETIVHSGSLSKQFVAGGIMSLVEDRRLSLSDQIGQFFPEAPESLQAITVRQLLTHTSGIVDYSDSVDLRRDYSEEELTKVALSQQLQFPPGSRWNYSNTNYLLLGILIHRIAGKPYGDLLHDRIFVPFGMKTARLATSDDLVPNRAQGYRIENGAVMNQEWVAPTLNRTADGGLLFSAMDLVAWDRGIRSRTGLTPSSWTEIFTPVHLSSGKTFPYGFGWELPSIAGRHVERHRGLWLGFTNYIARYVDEDLTIIILTNLVQPDEEQILRFVEGIAAGINPALAVPELKSIRDQDPDVTARVKQLLMVAANGKLIRNDFPYGDISRFFPIATAMYKEMLKGLGLPTRLELVDYGELGDDRVFVYDASFSSKMFRVKIGFAPDDKVSLLEIRPRF